MVSQFPDMTSSSIFLMLFFFLSSSVTGQVSCQYHHWFWSYEVLTGIPEIENTPVWVLANIWRLRRVRDTKFGTNISNKMLLHAGKCEGYNFCCFWVIKGKPSGSGWGGEGGGGVRPRLGLILLRSEFRSDLNLMEISSLKNSMFIYSIFNVFGALRKKSKYRKIQTRKNSVFGHFSRSDAGIKFFVQSQLDQVM